MKKIIFLTVLGLFLLNVPTAKGDTDSIRICSNNTTGSNCFVCSSWECIGFPVPVPNDVPITPTTDSVLIPVPTEVPITPTETIIIPVPNDVPITPTTDSVLIPVPTEVPITPTETINIPTPVPDEISITPTITVTPTTWWNPFSWFTEETTPTITTTSTISTTPTNTTTEPTNTISATEPVTIIDDGKITTPIFSLPEGQNLISVEKIEANEDVSNYYEVKTKKKARLFFIVPVSYETIYSIDPGTGVSAVTDRPWWNFLAW